MPQEIMLRNQIGRIEGVHWIINREAVLESWQTDLGEWWQSEPNCKE